MEQHVPGNPLAGVLDELFAVPIPMDIASETAARDTGLDGSFTLRIELF